MALLVAVCLALPVALHLVPQVAFPLALVQFLPVVLYLALPQALPPVVLDLATPHGPHLPSGQRPLAPGLGHTAEDGTGGHVHYLGKPSH